MKDQLRRDLRPKILKAESRALDDVKVAAGFGRHDQPENPSCPSWLPSWFCTPIVKQQTTNGDTTMAKQKKTAAQGVPSTPTPQTGVPKIPKKAGASAPAMDGAVNSSPPPASKARGSGSPGRKGGQTPKSPSVKQVNPTGSQGVDHRIVASQRVTPFYNTQVSTAFPQQRDLFMYGIVVAPAGASGSIAREHFETSLSLGIKTAIKRSLSYRAASAITTEQLADYFNTIAQAYFTLLSVGNHYSVLHRARRRPTLRLREGLIYNDESVPHAIQKLAQTLTPHYLPPKFIAMIEGLAKVYFVDNTPMCSMYQMVSWPQGTDTDANYVAHINTARANVESLVNAEDIITAFSQSRWGSEYIQLSNMQLGKYDDPDEFIQEYQQNVAYSNDMLDVWSNLPLEAGTGLVNKRYLLATRSTSVYRAVFGPGYTSVSNILTAGFVTADSIYQPGIIVPSVIGSTTGNNFRYVSTTGYDEAASITSISAIQFGVLARMVDMVYETTNTLRILPSGATYVTTNMYNIAEDANEVLDVMFGNQAKKK